MWKSLKGHFWSVAKVVIRIGCETWNSNLKNHLMKKHYGQKIGDNSCQTKFLQTIVRFWFFLSYLITTVTLIFYLVTRLMPILFTLWSQFVSIVYLDSIIKGIFLINFRTINAIWTIGYEPKRHVHEGSAATWILWYVHEGIKVTRYVHESLAVIRHVHEGFKVKNMLR